MDASTEGAERMTTTKQTLIAARALIEKPENWTRRALARDVDNISLTADDPDAICFCAIGAIRKIANSTKEEEFALEKLRQLDVVTSVGVAIYNDTHTHAEVLAMFDLAIEAAE